MNIKQVSFVSPKTGIGIKELMEHLISTTTESKLNAKVVPRFYKTFHDQLPNFVNRNPSWPIWDWKDFEKEMLSISPFLDKSDLIKSAHFLHG